MDAEFEAEKLTKRKTVEASTPTKPTSKFYVWVLQLGSSLLQNAHGLDSSWPRKLTVGTFDLMCVSLTNDFQ